MSNKKQAEKEIAPGFGEVKSCFACRFYCDSEYIHDIGICVKYPYTYGDPLAKVNEHSIEPEYFVCDDFQRG